MPPSVVARILLRGSTAAWALALATALCAVAASSHDENIIDHIVFPIGGSVVDAKLIHVRFERYDRYRGPVYALSVVPIDTPDEPPIRTFVRAKSAALEIHHTRGNASVDVVRAGVTTTFHEGGTSPDVFVPIEIERVTAPLGSRWARVAEGRTRPTTIGRATAFGVILALVFGVGMIATLVVRLGRLRLLRRGVATLATTGWTQRSTGDAELFVVVASYRDAEGNEHSTVVYDGQFFPAELVDDREEPVVYDPDHPGRAVLFDQLPGKVRVSSDGRIFDDGDVVVVWLIPYGLAILFAAVIVIDQITRY